MRHRPLWLFALISFCVVTAFLARSIDAVQMYPDEVLSYVSTEGSIADTINFQVSVRDNQAPLWFVIFWTWRQLAGDSEFAARVLSLLLTMMTVALACHLARDWFPSLSPWVDVTLPLLLLGNGFFFTYALDIRPYPLMLLAAVLSMAAFRRWLKRGSVRAAVLYGLTVALMLYVHYLLIFLVLAQALYFLLGRLSRRWIGQGLLAALVGSGLWLVWLPVFLRQVVHLHQVETVSGTARGLAGIGVVTQLTTPQNALMLGQTASNGLIWLYALVLVIGAIFLWRDKSYRLVLVWAFGAPLLTLAANFVLAVYTPRYLYYAVIGLMLALTLGLLSLPARLRQIGIVAVIGANLLTFSSAIPARVPYRDIYRLMSAEAQPGDVVLLGHGGRGDFVQWQYNHYLSPELRAAMTGDAASADQARRVWFLTDDWYSDDTRHIYERLEAAHRLQIVLGQCDRRWCYIAVLMEAPS